MNSPFVSQLPCQRTQEDGFCLVCFGKIPPFLLLSQTCVGKLVLGNATVISLEVWAEVTWGVLPSTACDVPRFQSGLHFSNPKPGRIGGITCPDPESSYLSMFHSCKLELFSQMNLPADHLPRNAAGGASWFSSEHFCPPSPVLSRWQTLSKDGQSSWGVVNQIKEMGSYSPLAPLLYHLWMSSDKYVSPGPSSAN